MSGLGRLPNKRFSDFSRRAKSEKYASVATLALLAGLAKALVMVLFRAVSAYKKTPTSQRAFNPFHYSENSQDVKPHPFAARLKRKTSSP